jgi:hypothetical protein
MFFLIGVWNEQEVMSMAVTIPFHQVEFPVKTFDRVPLEDIQLWAQFADMADVPESFGVVADALFALSWEVRVQDTTRRFEEALAQNWPDHAMTWVGLLADDLKNASRDWKDILLRLRRVMNGSSEYAHWQRTALEHLRRLEEMLRQIYSYAVGFGQHYGIALPERLRESIQAVQAMLADVDADA